jgi:hypothetical protein
MGEREKIISYLLAICDEKNRIIADLQAQLSATKDGAQPVSPQTGIEAGPPQQAAG